jgi:phenylpropionate dioxygenase-like ring-hydroxylating dioxygenase large terminal subunit
MSEAVPSPITVGEFDASCGDIDEVVSLPPAAFTSTEFFDFEMEAVFGHEWFCIGRATDIPKKGDYYTIDALGEQLLVVRQADGSIRVSSNVCRHRAMRVANGSGNARRFRCDYHSWVYGLDGTLQSAPDLNDNPCFNKSEIQLPEIRSEIWENFVFVTFDPDIPPLHERLANLAAHLAPWNMSELRSAEQFKFEEINCNWKIFGDECYHCAHLHSKSWVPLYDMNSETIDYETACNEPEKGIIAYDLVSGEEDLSPTRTGKNMQPLLPGLDSEKRKRLVYVTVAPNLLLIAMPDKVKYFMWLPQTVDTSVFAATWLYPQSTLDKPTFVDEWQSELNDLKEVMVEDIYAWESVQKGLGTRNAPRGRYAPSEIVLVRLNEWLVARYREQDQRAGSQRHNHAHAGAPV